MVDEQTPDQDQLAEKTKQERRQQRRAKKQAKMLQHGKSLARVYKDATSKRARDTKRRKQST
ncbi:MAG: hypothetical protein IBX67_05750 [Dehalococcoidia bacterium]|nr:hypothetical protein [Dehalococcoidia bacterium]